MGENIEFCMFETTLIEKRLAHAEEAINRKDNILADFHLAAPPGIKEAWIELHRKCGIDKKTLEKKLNLIDEVTKELLKKKKEIDWDKAKALLVRISPFGEIPKMAKFLQSKEKG